MSKVYTLHAKDLNILNNTLRDLNLSETAEILKTPIAEADGNFSSIIKTNDNFDPSNLNANIYADEEKASNTTKDDVTKEKILDKLANNLNSTIKNNEELKKLLVKLKKIKEEDNSAEWKINEAGNTAELSNKEAKIFKQNNNICLSHNGKIEIFKSVSDLHNWLKENNMPLPKNIKLHESSPWDSILNSITTNDGHKIGDTMPFTQEERDELNKKRSKPMVKMGNAEYKNAMRFLDKNKERLQSPIKGLTSEEMNEAQPIYSPSWFLEYKTSNYDNSLYLNSNWQDGNLLTNNLEQAAVFNTQKEAEDELDNIYSQKVIEAPFIPVCISDLNECFGTGTSNLGAAVQYTGNTKKESEDLEEGMYGYPGTPFENTYYTQKYKRASDYLKWYNTLDDNHKRNVDPNDANYKQAREELAAVQGRDRGAKHWAGNGVSDKDEDQMFRGVLDLKTGEALDKEAFVQRVKEINEKYGLDIHDNEAVISVRDPDKTSGKSWLKQISDHNKQQRDKWINDYYIPNRVLGIKGIKQKAQDRKNEYQDEIKAKNDPENIAKQQKYQAANEKALRYYTELADMRNDPNLDQTQYQFFDEFYKRANMLNTQEQKLLLDKLIDAGESGEIDLDDIMLMVFKDKRNNLKTESTFTKHFLDYLDGKTSNALLTEDDKPEDFADPTPQVQTSQDTVTQNDTPESDLNDRTTQDYAPDTDSIGNMQSGDSGAEFGGLNLGGFSGSNDTEENDMQNIQNMPEYRIVDVLINDEDPSDLRIKVKNLDTNEIEIKNLNEIDI